MSSAPLSSSEAVAQLRERVADFVGSAPTDIPPSANLVMLGLTSLNVMRLNTQLRRAGIPVDFDAMIANPTLADWTRQVEAAHTAQTAGS
jgi:aryl carrier-like protein